MFSKLSYLSAKCLPLHSDNPWSEPATLEAPNQTTCQFAGSQSGLNALHPFPDPFPELEQSTSGDDALQQSSSSSSRSIWSIAHY